MLDQQGGLPQPRQARGDTARLEFGFGAIGQQRAPSRHRRVERLILARRVREFLFHRGQGVGFALQGAQHIQRHDVARPFPYGIDRRFPVEPRHRPFFHIAVAAPDLHALRDGMDGAFADPELGGGRAHAHQRAGLGIGASSRMGSSTCIDGARQPQRQHHRRLAFQCQVCQHVTHQRLRDQRLAKGVAMLRVMQGLHQRLAQQRGAAQHAVQPRGGRHFQQHGQPATRFAHHHAPGILEFDFGTGVTAVAQLVFQAAHANGVARAVRNPARHEQATEPLVRVRQHQMRVRLRHRKKPLVSHQLIGVASARRAQGHRAGSDGAQVGAALLFGQPHAHQRAALGGQGRVDAIEFSRIERGQPLPGKVDGAGRLALQQRHGGKRHRGGAQGAGLDLPLH
ncbi:hypothetical protein D3C86_1125110 [compost metagenome]